MSLVRHTLLACLLGGTGILALTEPPAVPAPPVQAALPVPRLPAPPAPPAADEALALLATTTAWGPRPVAGGATAGAAANTPPTPASMWRLSGTLWRGGQWRVVLQDDQRLAPTQILATGDVMPDGRKVLEVRRDGVRLAAAPATLRQRPRPPAQEWVDVPRRALTP